MNCVQVANDELMVKNERPQSNAVQRPLHLDHVLPLSRYGKRESSIYLTSHR
jgi:hypothetical protein